MRAALLGLALVLVAVPTVSFAQMRDDAAMSRRSKRAMCAKEAKAMKFGIHVIKRERFIRKCMARTA